MAATRFLQESVPPTSSSRLFASLRGHNSRSATRLLHDVLDEENRSERDDHGHVSTQFGGVGSPDGSAGLCLEIEFGHGVGEALVHRFLEAGETDFLWDAWDMERWIGAFGSTDEDEIDLDLMPIFGRLYGKRCLAVRIVNGDGNPHELMGTRESGRRKQALAALSNA